MRIRIAVAGFGLALLSATAAYAQSSGMTTPPPIPLTPAQKAEIADQEAARRATDAQYNAAMKRTRDSDQKLDPWSNLRAPSGHNAVK